MRFTLVLVAVALLGVWLGCSDADLPQRNKQRFTIGCEASDCYVTLNVVYGDGSVGGGTVVRQGLAPLEANELQSRLQKVVDDFDTCYPNCHVRAK